MIQIQVGSLFQVHVCRLHCQCSPCCAAHAPRDLPCRISTQLIAIHNC